MVAVGWSFTLADAHLISELGSEDSESKVVVLTQCGWPAQSVKALDLNAGVPLHQYALAVPWFLQKYPEEPRRLAYIPLWPGFAINTLFYAAVLWMLWSIPFALRRMIRKRRGQCEQCAYPIGTNPSVPSAARRSYPRAPPSYPRRRVSSDRAATDIITLAVCPLDSRLRGNDGAES